MRLKDVPNDRPDEGKMGVTLINNKDELWRKGGVPESTQWGRGRVFAGQDRTMGGAKENGRIQGHNKNQERQNFHTQVKKPKLRTWGRDAVAWRGK